MHLLISIRKSAINAQQKKNSKDNCYYQDIIITYRPHPNSSPPKQAIPHTRFIPH